MFCLMYSNENKFITTEGKYKSIFLPQCEKESQM